MVIERHKNNKQNKKKKKKKKMGDLTIGLGGGAKPLKANKKKKRRSHNHSLSVLGHSVVRKEKKKNRDHFELEKNVLLCTKGAFQNKAIVVE